VIFLRSVRRLLVTASVVPSSLILVTLMKEVLSPPKRQFLQEPHGVTSHKTPFFTVSETLSFSDTRKIGTIDNAKKDNNCIDIPSGQASTSCAYSD
jgi:hypothetical protein